VSVETTRRLPSGALMPTLGLGVWQMDEGRETEQAVEWALAAGYRHVDTAAMYRNERSVGVAIRRSAVPRESVFVTTKLMPARLDAERALDQSLGRLGFDYVDLYLIHWPLPAAYPRQWRKLESLREQGLARDIGVSNFGVRELDALARRGDRVPAVNQVQFSPFEYRRGLLDECEQRGIVLEAYSPLAQGSGPGNPAIVAVAERVGRTPAQVMLRWALQRGTVVIPKSSRRERIESNAQVFDFELDDRAMAELDALDRSGGTIRARGR
jgi:diketogulonate reductase-like aldo/keto reductase